MTMDTLLAKVAAAGRKALTEYESKQLLGAFGIPVIHETVAGHGRRSG